MNHLMTGRGFLIPALLAAYALAAPLGAADVEAVSSPAKRQEALVQAKELLSEKTSSLSGKNPFNPEGFGESAPDAVPTPATNTAPAAPRNLLQTIAASLKPNLMNLPGTGEPVLVFGQKRVKAGGTLTITFEGSEYNLEVVSINRPNFTLRLNREEFTRPIK